jgi:hypothetical protein
MPGFAQTFGHETGDVPVILDQQNAHNKPRSCSV